MSIPTDTKTVLELIQSMERARASGRTDEEQTTLDHQKAICLRYVNFLIVERDQYKSTNLPEILELHLVALAASMQSAGISEIEALAIGLKLSETLLVNILGAYKDAKK